MNVYLGVLGWRDVTRHPREAGHWLWLDSFGWHDCTPNEDAICEAAARKLEAG